MRMPEMKVDVSVGGFHAAHTAAEAAEKLIEAGMGGLSTLQIKEALAKLRAGQRLTDAEDGPDADCATDYGGPIRLVESELKRRGVIA